MTQKSIAEQIADAQNVLVALSKKVAQEVIPVTKEVDSITVAYQDGTTETFVKQQDTKASEILAQLRDRATARASVVFAPDPLPAKQLKRGGFKCRIHGVNYTSIMHASRSLDICRHAIRARLNRGDVGYDYV